MNELLDLIVRVRGEVEVTLGFLIAIIITVHVLLTKREVAAAVGWIGLAWFSPFLGGLTYFVLGINRVHRRGRRLRGGPRNPLQGGGEPPRVPEEDDHLAPLRRGVGAIARRPSPPGNAIQTLHNGDEAYPAMLAAIEGAQRSVGLSTYIMRADTTGKKFVEALKAAKARGVEVRVIVDGVGSGWLISPAYSLLRRAGIPAGRFMHSSMPWRMPFLNLRSHKKILVVDGALGFIGGINIADQNVLKSKPRDPVQDNHFRVRGPVVGQLVEAFARDWALVSEEELDGPAWFPELAAEGEDEARVVTAGPDADLEKIESVVLQAIACARDSIRLMTPYFLPDQQLITALSLAAMRGVSVEVVIPQKGNHRLVNWATRANVGPLLHNGVRIWRSPQPFRHSKTLVVDSAWSLIGSSNWDMRSFRLNFELCIEVYSRPLAKELETLMTDCCGRALEIAELDARILPLRLSDASARLLLPYL